MTLFNNLRSIFSSKIPCSNDKILFYRSVKIKIYADRLIKTWDEIKNNDNPDLSELSKTLDDILSDIGYIIGLVGGKWIKNNIDSQHFDTYYLQTDKLSIDGKTIINDLYNTTLFIKAIVNRNISGDISYEQFSLELVTLQKFSKQLHCRIIRSPFFKQCSKGKYSSDCDNIEFNIGNNMYI